MNARHEFHGGLAPRHHRSARRPARRPNWDWVPEQYLWAFDGFDDEYDDWDEPISHREFRDAPSERGRDSYSPQGSSFMPWTRMGRRASANHHVHRSNDAYDDDFDDFDDPYGEARYSQSGYDEAQYDDYGHGGHFEADDYCGDDFEGDDFGENYRRTNDVAEDYYPQDSFYGDDYGDDRNDSYQWSEHRPRRGRTRTQHRRDYDDAQPPGQYGYFDDRPMQYQGEDDEYQRSSGREELSFTQHGGRRRRPVRESVDPARVKRLKTRYAAEEAAVSSVDKTHSMSQAPLQSDDLVGSKPRAVENPIGRVQPKSQRRVQRVSKAGALKKPRKRVPRKPKS